MVELLFVLGVMSLVFIDGTMGIIIGVILVMWGLMLEANGW